MATSALKRIVGGLVPILGLVALLLFSLSLMSEATQDSARFSELYSWLLVANALGLLVLAGLISWNLVRLVQQVRAGRAGARLTARLVIVFAILSVTPVVVVYHFSLKFLNEGIDSWFDVRIDHALEDAIELGRTALGIRMREHLKQTQVLASELTDRTRPEIAAAVDDARRLSGAWELTLMASSGQVIASSNEEPTSVVPHRPSDTTTLQVRQSGNYIGLDPIGADGLYIRVVIALAGESGGREQRMLQALFPVPERMNDLASTVESAYAEYRELAYLRTPLKTSFTLMLSLVLFLSLLTALWAAFYSARRVVAPLRHLAEGTRAVAEGDLETRVVPSGHDEIGFLLESFNDMTSRLRHARDEARHSQLQVEAQRAYLETVLARLSTGVLTLDTEGKVFTCNAAGAQILDIDRDRAVGCSLEELAREHASVGAFVQAAGEVVNDAELRPEVSVDGPRGNRILTLGGTALASGAGHVLVFDDITALIQAQRESAWSEVARRLAHEIKNPLTPIQLSAERVRHKYLDRMTGADRETLDRLTRTIVQQVEAMKTMVNAFSEYARSPVMKPRRLHIDDLVRDVCELYQSSDARQRLDTDLAGEAVDADPDRLRQILHNLIKNALEASPDARVQVRTRLIGKGTTVELEVRDDGPGFPPDLISRIFEPYVTSKARGSGLGLAIVKRIVEEHGGSVRAENLPQRGGRVAITLPRAAAEALRPEERQAV